MSELYAAFLECVFAGMEDITDPGLDFWERVVIAWRRMYGEQMAL